MGLITQTIPSLLNGVSQRSPRLRHPTQADEQVNGLSHFVRGLMKRPPLVHEALLDSNPTGYDTAEVRTLQLGSGKRFRLVVTEGNVRVFDHDSGAEIPVYSPRGMGYLSQAPDGFRTVTAGERTYIINRAKTVQRGTKVAPPLKNEALVYVRQADFGTRYTITLNGEAVEYTTVLGQSPQARPQIDTDAVAGKLFGALLNKFSGTGFTFRLRGSTIHIFREDGADFRLEVSDGLADRGLVAVKEKAQLFEDLPLRAPHGFTVQVTGDPANPHDNYWVQFDDTGAAEGGGVWKEVPSPGSPVEIDASTMPHELAYRGIFLGPVAAAAPPPAPTVRDEVYEYTSGGWTDGSDGPVNPIREQTLTMHGQYYRTEIPGANGSVRDLIFRWDVDTSQLTLMKIYIILSYYHASTGEWEVLTRSEYEAGQVYPDQQYVHRAALHPGDQVEIRLEYSTGLTPAPSRRVYVNTRSSDGGPTATAVVVQVARGKRISYDPRAMYPAGTTITVTCDGTPFNYSVPNSGDQPGSVVFAALQQAISDTATYVVPNWSYEEGWFDITREDGNKPAVSVSTGFNPATMVWLPDAHMPVGAFSGMLVENLTDGSKGSVSNNSVSVLFLTSLSGGTDNTTERGDRIQVTKEGDYFAFQPVPWKERQAGGEEEDPFPSFVGQKIRGGFFHRGRLGFLSGDTVVLSAAGDPTRFFRGTAQAILDDDPIDIRSAGKDAAVFHSATEWDHSLILWSDTGAYRLDGSPMLTPTTVMLRPVGRYLNDPDVEPQILGGRAYFVQRKANGADVMEAWNPDGERIVTVEATADVPTYIQGRPKRLAGDPNRGFLLVLTDANRLYCFVSAESGGERIQSSWSRWEISGVEEIIGAEVESGKITLVTRHTNGVYLGSIDLDAVPTPEEKVSYLDRRCVPTALYDPVINTTIFTLPYRVSGEALLVDRDALTVIPTQQFSDTTLAAQGDYTGRRVYAGLRYEFYYRFSPIYVRDSRGIPDGSGRLQLRYVDLWYHDTTDATLEVTPQGRSTYTYQVNHAEPEAGSLRVPIQARSEDTTLVIRDNTPGGCTFSSLDWYGFYATRSRRT